MNVQEKGGISSVGEIQEVKNSQEKHIIAALPCVISHSVRAHTNMQNNVAKSRGSPTTQVMMMDTKSSVRIHSLVHSRKVVELRKICKQYGLVQHGTKNELQHKIIEYLKKNPATEFEMISFVESLMHDASSNNNHNNKRPRSSTIEHEYRDELHTTGHSHHNGNNNRDTEDYDNDDDDDDDDDDENFVMQEEVAIPPPLKKRFVRRTIDSGVSHENALDSANERKPPLLVQTEEGETYISSSVTSGERTSPNLNDEMSFLMNNEKAFNNQELIDKLHTIAEKYKKVQEENYKLRIERDSLIVTNSVLESKINCLRRVLNDDDNNTDVL